MKNEIVKDYANNFATLCSINVSENLKEITHSSGLRLTYLSWPYAVKQLRMVCPDARWDVVRFDNGNGVREPYLSTKTGYYVEVSVTVDDVTLSQIHPVLDKRNKVIQEPDAFDINTSIQRCLVKAIALHGLGLGVYAGEDLPAGNSQPTPKPMPIKPPQANNIPPKPAESTNGRVVSGVQMEFGKYSGFYVNQIDNEGYLNYLTDRDGTHKLQEFLAKGKWPDNYCNDIMEAAGKQLFKLQNPGMEIEKSPVGVGFAQKDAKAEEYNQEEPETFEKQNKKDDDIPF